MWKATPIAFALFVIAAGSGASQGPASSGEATPGAVTRWDYRVLTKDQVVGLGKKDLAAGLNALGEEGWELAAVESAYIFKRPKQQKTLEDLERQVPVAESDLAMQKDRTVWSERMAKKGFLSEEQVQMERQRLTARELALDRAKRELEAFPADPQKVPQKDPKRDK